MSSKKKTKRFTRKNIFWIFIILISVIITMILFNIGNIDIEIGLLSGLVAGLIIEILSWLKK